MTNNDINKAMADAYQVFRAAPPAAWDAIEYLGSMLKVQLWREQSGQPVAQVWRSEREEGKTGILNGVRVLQVPATGVGCSGCEGCEFVAGGPHGRTPCGTRFQRAAGFEPCGSSNTIFIKVEK